MKGIILALAAIALIATFSGPLLTKFIPEKDKNYGEKLQKIA